jgi:hypothetical protein
LYDRFLEKTCSSRLSISNQCPFFFIELSEATLAVGELRLEEPAWKLPMPLLRPLPLDPPFARGAELRGEGEVRKLRMDPEELEPEARIEGREKELLLPPKPPLRDEEEALSIDPPKLRLPLSEAEKPRLLGPQPELPRL